jgi:hypothetical protein
MCLHMHASITHIHENKLLYTTLINHTTTNMYIYVHIQICKYIRQYLLKYAAV